MRPRTLIRCLHVVPLTIPIGVVIPARVLFEVEVGLPRIFPFYLAIAFCLVTNAGSKAVVNGEIRNLLDDEPTISIASDGGHGVSGMDRPMSYGGVAAAREDVKVHGQKATVVPKRVPESVPARDADKSRGPARAVRRRIRRIRAQILRKGARPGGIRAGVDEEPRGHTSRTGARIEHEVPQVTWRWVSTVKTNSGGLVGVDG